MKRFNKKGFTIVELVIVIAVIGILAGVLIPTFSSITQRANETAAMQEATAGRDAILVLTQGTMNNGTQFYVIEEDNGAYNYNYVFKYENGAMNAQDVSDTITAPTYRNGEYVVYIAAEIATADGFNQQDAYALYLAKLVGATSVSSLVKGTDKIVITTNDNKVINVYWSADLHDTLIIFLAGTQTQQTVTNYTVTVKVGANVTVKHGSTDVTNEQTIQVAAGSNLELTVTPDENYTAASDKGTLSGNTLTISDITENITVNITATENQAVEGGETA